jgi:hypothetical protein
MWLHGLNNSLFVVSRKLSSTHAGLSMGKRSCGGSLLLISVCTHLVLEESVPSISECGGGVSQPSDDIET